MVQNLMDYNAKFTETVQANIYVVSETAAAKSYVRMN
jgi:hypothetical protein